MRGVHDKKEERESVRIVGKREFHGGESEPWERERGEGEEKKRKGREKKNYG